MKHRNRGRVLATALTLVMAVSMLPAPAFASIGSLSPSAAEPVQSLAGDSAIDVEIPAAVSVAPTADATSSLSAGIAVATLSDEDEEAGDVATVGGTGYATLGDAIAAGYSTGNEVLLVADVENEAVNIGVPATLNLQGHSITTSASYTLFATADVTIKGSGSIVGGSYGVVADGATVTLDGVAVTAGVAAHVQNSGGLVTQNGATLTGTSSHGLYVGTGNTAEIGGSTVVTGAYYGVVNHGSLTVSGTASVGATTYYGVLNYGTASMTGGVVTGPSMAFANLGTFTLKGGTVGSGSSAYGIVNQGGTATISGGTVTGSSIGLNVTYGGTANLASSGKVTSTAGYAVEIDGDVTEDETDGISSTLNMIGGEISATEGSLPCGVVIMGHGATFKMRDGAISAAAYAISGNGLAKNAGTYIEIGGGTITSTGETACAIYHPQAGELNINGMPAITGKTGVQLCSGEGVVGAITGGTITATGTDQSAGKTGDGVVPDGAAISILDRSYPGGTPEFEIVGGVFKSQNNDAVKAYTWDGTTQSNWANAGEYVSIKGGLYYGHLSDPSEASAPQYVANGYAAVKYDSTGYRVGKQVTLTLGSEGVNDAGVTYEVKANTADSVSDTIPANSDNTYTVVAGSEITVSATTDSGYVTGWTKGSTTLSAMSSCRYQVIGDSTLIAHLSEAAVAEAPVVSVSMTEGSAAYNRYYFTVAATYNVPSQYEIVQVGIDTGTSEGSFSDRIPLASNAAAQQGIYHTFFVLPTTSYAPLYLRAYVIVQTDDGQEIFYSDDAVYVDGSQYETYTDVLGFAPQGDAANL